MINTIIAILWLLGLLVTYMLLLPNSLHMMQLQSYHSSEYFNWIIKNGKKVFKSGAIQFLIYTLALVIVFCILKITTTLSQLGSYLCFIFLSLAFFIPNIIQIVKDFKERKKAKKPLKYTARIKRLYFFSFLTVIILRVLFTDYLGESEMSLMLVYSFLIFTIPFNTLIANVLADPTETLINNHYINSAARKLRKKEYSGLIKIGITGSYGKTSTKYILQTILSEKYNVLATPESYNTTMGNVRTIREKLKPEHQIFISEMGARKRYDIQEICNFVRPQIGIITSIGPQHLETFKKIENVVKTKSELLAGLTYDGVAFLPVDDKYCKEVYDKEKHEKHSYGFKNSAEVYATDIKLSVAGSTFTVVTKDDKFVCTTKLLGEHSVQNIIGCIAVALHLGLTKEEIVKGVEKVEAVPHRLQLIPSANGGIVIDDAFNSNPVGSKMALDVLKNFEGKKIIVTPGMVELGAEEYKLNKEFGKQIAEVVDVAILVGIKRSKPIEEGLREKKFDENNIYVVTSLEEATNRLAKLASPNNVVLFENDLPDNYNE